MCGIYGIFDPSEPLGERWLAWAQRAQGLLAHRGPDGHRQQLFLDRRCLLGHNRLAIIDLEGGAQPLANEDQSVWVVCNGEIYNYVELRKQLIAAGHQFRTQSDCEVLVHLFEDKGKDLLNDLEGMFAFALFDARRGELFLARDRFGEKPLYWARLADGGLAFASEMKALLALPGVDRRLDIAAIAQFMSLRYVPAPRTHVQGIRKLQAGESICLGPSAELASIRFWCPELFANGNQGSRVPSVEEAVEGIRDRVREAVRIRLRSDVAVGAFLSGGIDSTAVACAVRELLPAARFSTFCASFDDEELDESPFARRIATRLDSNHHEVHFSASELLPLFEELIDHYDEPFADVSMFPTFAVCRAARQDCKVMLSGDGGDECFAGYRQTFSYYRWNQLRRTPGVNFLAESAFHHLHSGQRGRGLLNFLRQNDWQLLRAGYAQTPLSNWFLPSHREEAQSGLEDLQVADRHHARLPYPLSEMEATWSGYLPEQILVKVDRASMYSALECRAPFLDSSLFQFVTHLPLRYHFSHGQGKALLRKALPAWVPPEIRWRQKQGFTPPLAAWLRTELRERVENDLEHYPAALQAVLDPAPARELFARHLAGADRSDQLFRWMVLIRRAGQL
ncbi:MAG: asparagine synthase (glutamine-hydrolyzing) [Candidatus Sulfotelmatobacter sp.]